jgi:hypothetical protein
MDRRLLSIATMLAATAPLSIAPGGNAAAAQTASARGSLCAADETILFQCRSGMKLISLCGRRTPVPGARLLYGNPGHLDYASPADAAFAWTEQGDVLDVHIRDAGREHLLYSHDSGGNRSADGRLGAFAIEGFVVDRGGGVGVDHRCAGEASRRGRLQDFMPEDTTPER